MKIYYYYSTMYCYLLFLFYCLMPCLTKAALTNIDTDRTALLAFKSELDLNPSHVLSHNWSDSTPVCSWFGVTCNPRHQRVNTLNISSMSIKGNLVPQLGNLSFLVSLNLSYNNFQGNVPQELTQLRRLRILNLRKNNLTGEFPSWFGSFPNLRSLNLRNNTLTGVIPPSLSNLSRLEVLDLSFNSLGGVIPHEIGDLRNLRALGLQGNQLTGPMPLTLFKIPKLRVLALVFNRLQGIIPREVGNLTLLEELYLGVNELTGQIPSDLLNISTLRVLVLRANQLTGNLPSNLGQSLPNLEWLDIGQNNFTSESSDLSFITSLTNCRFLDTLEMDDNPLNGTFPSSIGNISSVTYLYGFNCGLYGRIPDEIGNLTSLLTLLLYGNQLEGLLPETMGNIRTLQVLSLHENKLEGTIPSTMCNFLYLFRLALSGNRFSDEIPSCVRNLTSLRILQLDNNKWNSTIPSSLWHLQHLLTLDLSSNFFVGSLPPEIGNLKSATEINLSMNQLSGNIPRAIEDLKNLETFSLARNGFQGSIPESIGQMVSLESLDLSQNNLSGPIPFSLENLTYLFYFNVSFNDLSGEIPSDGPFKNFTSQSFLSNKRLCGDLKYNVAPCNVITKRSKGKRKLLVVLISLGISGLVFALILSYLFAKYKRKEGVLVGTFDWSGPTPVRFSYYELMKATNGYDESNLLGRGSFGSVYRGNLRNGKDVAVKVFNLQSERASNSFEIECEILRKLRHKNLCKVISSCCSQDFRALVLEYASNGSLEKWLYSHNYFLDIVQRIRIMIDIASAMEYLHYGYSTPIIHCDLKPSNILLDEHMSARLCDFGIAKLMNDGESVVRTITLATMGYIAPEFGLDGLVSKRCDVYSYGIVLMEVFTRMRPDDEAFGGDLSLRSWVKERMPDGIIHITDSNLLKLDEEFHKEKLSCLASIFELALCCCMESPSERINIKDVRVALEKIKHQLQAYYNPEIKK